MFRSADALRLAPRGFATTTIRFAARQTTLGFRPSPKKRLAGADELPVSLDQVIAPQDAEVLLEGAALVRVAGERAELGLRHLHRVAAGEREQDLHRAALQLEGAVLVRRRNGPPRGRGLRRPFRSPFRPRRRASLVGSRSLG